MLTFVQVTSVKFVPRDDLVLTGSADKVSARQRIILKVQTIPI